MNRRRQRFAERRMSVGICEAPKKPPLRNGTGGSDQWLVVNAGSISFALGIASTSVSSQRSMLRSNSLATTDAVIARKQSPDPG
jgi:hypothetical protein